MSLRRKLLLAFGALATLSILLAGLTFYTIQIWNTNEEEISDHYARSLMAQRVRAATFRAFKEVPDAVTGDDPDSREEFDEYIKPAKAALLEWELLSHTAAEKRQVEVVEKAFEVLLQNADKAFTMVETGRRKEAALFMENELEDRSFAAFDSATSIAVASDRKVRQQVREETETLQSRTRSVLVGSALATLILFLLLVAYLSGDVFAPLRDVRERLDDFARGDRKARLDDERDDEIGEVNAAFNRAVEATIRRENIASLGVENDSVGIDNSTKLAIHTLITRLRGKVAQLRSDSHPDLSHETPLLLGEIDELLHSAGKIAKFSMPLDLNLSKVNISTLLYELVLRFHEQFAERGVSFELDVATDVKTARLDGLKIREALGECLSNSLHALPQSGGRIAIRARIETAERGNDLVLEVADDGQGSDSEPFENELDDREKIAVGLQLTRSTVEAHGGYIDVQSSSGKGTYVAMRIPLRE